MSPQINLAWQWLFLDDGIVLSAFIFVWILVRLIHWIIERS